MYFFNPPYFLFVASLLAAIACGKAFEATLKQQVDLWSKSRSSRILQELQGAQLLIPYYGICLGTLVFLGCGMMIFGVPASLSFAMALVLTVFTGLLLWVQLGKILQILQEGGSQALDLDALERRS
ncbi:hypothetical protein [Lyngbya confervoides]|uniref:DUF2721 domain-containing protein n=1 Tax=Lyngbya confervoides BDU141951 TaxID=1574623 RepID=A0ABD4T146_9CYAN|nr:hypothetical protein [Lyngbya confervoides]MCM1982491.1 hypothetical protein [Lyngbya confervoides BDU141951]